MPHQTDSTMCYETGLKLMVIDDAIGTAHDHNNIMSSMIIYMHYVNCTCARGVRALRALVSFCNFFMFPSSAAS